MALEGRGFVRPVPVAVTTVRLVREAEIQLRRPRLHLIPLEQRTLSPRPNLGKSSRETSKPTQTSLTGNPQ